MKELRCDCGRLICKYENSEKIEAKCPRCKSMVVHEYKPTLSFDYFEREIIRLHNLAPRTKKIP